jgi:hypothetical protein
MNDYDNIDFDKFACESIPISMREKRKLYDDFAGSSGAVRPRFSGGMRFAAVAACLAICMMVTPLGQATWAGLQKFYEGIGTVLGMPSQDEYATHVDQTVEKGRISVRLMDVTVDGIYARCSFTVSSQRGNAPSADVMKMKMFINGKASGYRYWGSYMGGGDTAPTTKYVAGVMCAEVIPYEPKVTIVIPVAGKDYKFSFVLDNKKIKDETRTIPVGRTIEYAGQKTTIEKLVITPVSQALIISDGNFNCGDIRGTDDQGHKVDFQQLAGYRNVLFGSENAKSDTKEAYADVRFYKFKVMDPNLTSAIDTFTVKVR